MVLEEMLRQERKTGYAIGHEDGEDRINQLNQLLIKDNRLEDLLKSTEDAAYQRKLLAEYGL